MYTQVKGFLCPSDPGAGTGYAPSNNYFASVGTTTNLVDNSSGAVLPTMRNLPTTGLFAYQQSYGFRDCIDGSRSQGGVAIRQS